MPKLSAFASGTKQECEIEGESSVTSSVATTTAASPFMLASGGSPFACPPFKLVVPAEIKFSFPGYPSSALETRQFVKISSSGAALACFAAVAADWPAAALEHLRELIIEPPEWRHIDA